MAGNGEELATAYISLYPNLNTKGLAGQLKGIDASPAGQAVGNTFGGKFVGAAKAVIGAWAVTELAQTVGNFAKTALDAFADYEQLSGGVEKIFDDMDNSAIFADAADAYKTLNMSANDYLETINDVGANFAATMGDQAGYDTANKGLTAISDFASGTGKNLDVLKEKFGMITKSTSSYQSIADQFGGVLPATAAAFLENAQAAGFLSDSYGKLTEVPIDEYQQAVAAMLEKGVADLNLAGNTAAETASTVSGSLAAVGGAWQNWLAGLANEEADMGLLTDQLLEAVSVAASNVIPRIGQIFTSLGSTLHEQIPILLDSLIAKVSESGVGMGEAALEMLGSIAVSIASYTPQILAALGLMLASLIVAVGNKAIEMTEKGVELMSGVAGGIADGASFVLSEIDRGISDGVQRVKDKVKDFIDAGKSIIEGLAQGIKNAVGSVTGAIGDVMASVREYLPFSPAKKGAFSGKGWTLYSGRSMGGALAQGIAQSSGVVTGAIGALMGNAQAALAKANPTLSVSAALRGTSLDMGAFAGGSDGGRTVYQTFHINQKVSTPGEMMRAARLEAMYGTGAV